MVAVAAVGLQAGCVAAVTEERGYGAARPAPGATSEVTEERRTAPSELHATMKGTVLTATVVEPTECRDVVSTRDMVREVDVHRTFTDPRQQQWDLALALLAGGGAALVAYDGNGPWACPGNRAPSGCAGQVGSAAGAVEWPLIALAAVPGLLVAYNAARTQDSRQLERSGPERNVGQWNRCASRPLDRESITVTVDDRPLTAVTGADGAASVDLAPLLQGAKGGRAVVHHDGSEDVVVSLDDIPAAR
jgi:hypothetical protein